MTPAKIYPFSIPAGGSFPLLVLGDYCKILTSSGPLSLTGDSFGTLGPILAGQGVEQTPFKRLVLTDQSGAVNTGTILIADNKFIDDRITGEVSVIDGGKSRTASGKAFFYSAYLAALAANFSHVQFKNPTGSGVNVYVEQITSASELEGFRMGAYATDLTTSLGNTPMAKDLTAAMGVLVARSQQNAVHLFAGSTQNYRITPNGATTMSLREPILIKPGQGLMFAGNVANQSASIQVEYFEEAIL